MDTRRLATALRDAGCALVLVAGGDGTIRDVLGAVGHAVPILGIPTGVKMHSAVFAPTPGRAGEIAAAALADSATPIHDAEVMDLDEEELRRDRIVVRLFGFARVPAPRSFRPAAKASPRIVDDAALDAAAAELAAEMEPGRVYVLGPGTTTRRVAMALGLDKTLLGVDAVLDRRLVARDAGEAELLRLTADRPTSLVVGVTGGQGFVFGRGNQQIGPQVIARAGRDAIIVLAGPEKLSALVGAPLLVDTGDPEVDRMLEGWIRVRTGQGRSTLMRLRS
jgi:predicted polyphosphate/ATP-dependent NAD kinase